MAFEVDPVEDLSAAVDWFVEAIGPRAPQPFRRVEDPASAARDVANMEARLVPYSLPAEIRWFWETWDADRFDILFPMPLEGPGQALFGWNLMAWENPGSKALVPIGYASHDYLVVDVTAPASAPAPVWLSTVGGDVDLVAPSLATLFRSCAERAEALFVAAPEDPATSEWYRDHGDAFYGPELQAIIDRHLAASGLRRQHVDEFEPETWPAAWHEAQRAMTGGSTVPLGRTHSVAEFVALLDDGTPRARLWGDLAEVSGGASRGREALMRLTDGSGSVDLSVPPEALPPGWVPGEGIEVEVVGRGPLPTWVRHELDPVRRAEIEAQHGSVELYVMNLGGRSDPDVVVLVRANVEAAGDYKERLPLVERSSRTD